MEVFQCSETVPFTTDTLQRCVNSGAAAVFLSIVAKMPSIARPVALVVHTLRKIYE